MKETRVIKATIWVRETERAIASGVALFTLTPVEGEPFALEVPISAMKKLLADLPAAISLLEFRMANPLKYKGPH